MPWGSDALFTLQFVEESRKQELIRPLEVPFLFNTSVLLTLKVTRLDLIRFQENNFFMYIRGTLDLQSTFAKTGKMSHIRSLRVDLGICILLRWIQVLGCVLDYKSFRSVRVDANKLLPKQKQKTIVTQPSAWCDVIRDSFK